MRALVEGKRRPRRPRVPINGMSACPIDVCFMDRASRDMTKSCLDLYYCNRLVLATIPPCLEALRASCPDVIIA